MKSLCDGGGTFSVFPLCVVESLDLEKTEHERLRKKLATGSPRDFSSTKFLVQVRGALSNTLGSGHETIRLTINDFTRYFLFVQHTKDKIKTIAFVNVVFWFSTIADIAHIKFLLHNRIPEQTTYGLSELVLHSLCLERALPIHPASVPRHSVQHG